MTIKQLIEELSRMPQDAEVRIKQPAHDYWRTMKTAEVRTVDTETLEWSGYHSTFVMPRGSVDLDDDRPENKLTAVVLG